MVEEAAVAAEEADPAVEVEALAASAAEAVGEAEPADPGNISWSIDSFDNKYIQWSLLHSEGHFFGSSFKVEAGNIH